MQVVFLDSKTPSTARYTFEGADIVEYGETAFADLADRCRHADLLVTTIMPLRREILDYVTRPRHIVVPRQHVSRLVEHEIASQLEITVHAIDVDPSDWSQFRNAALSVVLGIMSEK